MKKILFVCNGNVFRSVSAELLLEKKLLEKNINNIKVFSAGISKNIGYKKREINSVVKKELEKLNVDTSKHERKLVSQSLLEKCDVIITMTNKQKKYIKEKFNKNSILFNKICFNENTDFLDEFEKYSSFTSEKEINNYLRESVKKINKGVNILVNSVINNKISKI